MTAADLGWLGLWLFVGSVAAIAIEMAVMGIWGLRLARRGRALSEALLAQRGLIEDDLQSLRAAMEETRILWRPYRRVPRWRRLPPAGARVRSSPPRRGAAGPPSTR